MSEVYTYTRLLDTQKNKIHSDRDTCDIYTRRGHVGVEEMLQAAVKHRYVGEYFNTHAGDM